MTKYTQQLASLDELLARCRSYPDSFRGDQRSSFAFANAKLDGVSIAQASIRVIEGETVHPGGASDGGGVRAARNLLEQYDLVVDLANRDSAAMADFPITANVIKDLHGVAMGGILLSSGQYRDIELFVSGSELRLPQPGSISGLVEELVAYLRDNWDAAPASHLAAYALWRFLWIHPFEDGNGRVGRALAYLIFSMKAGRAMPGTPTLPELIVRNRESYYKALKSADDSLRRGRVDVSELRKLLERLIVLQLSNIPPIDDHADRRIEYVVSSRISGADIDIRKQAFGSEKPEWFAWLLGSYLAFYVGDKQQVRAASRRQLESGSPFPSLLSDRPEGDKLTRGVGAIRVMVKQRVRGEITADSDATIVMQDCSVSPVIGSPYNIGGTLVITKLGVLTTTDNFDQSLDVALSRQISLIQSGLSAPRSS